jgi:hypothetical protein
MITSSYETVKELDFQSNRHDKSHPEFIVLSVPGHLPFWKKTIGYIWHDNLGNVV